MKITCGNCLRKCAHIEGNENGRYSAEEGKPGATEQADDGQHNGEGEVVVS